MQNIHITNSDKPVTLYNLNVIIADGYRVKSPRGTGRRGYEKTSSAPAARFIPISSRKGAKNAKDVLVLNPKATKGA